jgi:hypothetical protein
MVIKIKLEHLTAMLLYLVVASSAMLRRVALVRNDLVRTKILCISS